MFQKRYFYPFAVAILSAVSSADSAIFTFSFDDESNGVGIPPMSSTSSGWEILNLTFTYDDASDELRAVMTFDGIAGDADGDGDPATFSSISGGSDFADLGGSEIIAIAFDLDGSGIDANSGQGLDTVIGVPNGGALDTGSLQLEIAAFDSGGGSISNVGLGFGAADTSGAVATLAHNPSAIDPTFDFTVNDWSSLASSPTQFDFLAFAGSFDDGGFGEDNLTGSVPEPSTAMLLSLGGMALMLRRRSN